MAKAATVTEANFKWEGTDRGGNRVKGVTQGPSEGFVKLQLRKQGVNPISVRKQSTLFAPRKRKITTMDVAIFLRQMATMMSAGVPLVQALEIIGRGHENPSMGELILGVKAHVESGNSFADGLKQFPLYFDDLVVNLIDAGEKSGTLETLLDKVAMYKEKTEAIKKKVKKALTYPTAVIVVAFIVTGILLYFVVPQFQELFQGFGADLPAFTMMVIGLSEFVQAKWWLVLLSAGGGIYALFEGKRRSAAFRRFLDRLLLKLPIIGDILYKSAVARFARTLSTMFAAGVPLVEAMEPVAKAAGNIIFQEAIMVMRNQVASGQQLQLTMQQANLFPNMATQMVAIGEESGALDSMCAKVADFYEAEVDNLVDTLSSLLEPMIMPIFKLGSVV
jgi:type IV pilus assembly protein PilC